MINLNDNTTVYHDDGEVKIPKVGFISRTAGQEYVADLPSAEETEVAAAEGKLWPQYAETARELASRALQGEQGNSLAFADYEINHHAKQAGLYAIAAGLIRNQE